ncbi:hypothetical protein E2C01_075158 [Portunus trituberculatus]|uniref:Uncharacterized protein n=1 Tax=Portunus trituberculatus TaxID=210409 RepID=A0A5B7IF38_PORTR|nr:hypothetical protein [Portunus trituberculatus]
MGCNDLVEALRLWQGGARRRLGGGCGGTRRGTASAAGQRVTGTPLTTASRQQQIRNTGQ